MEMILSDKYHCYFFDLDGTLIDSKEDIAMALLRAYEETKIKPNLDKLVIGPPLKVIIQHLTPELTDAQVASLCERFRKIYNGASLRYTKLFGGVREGLERLKTEGKVLCLATNKPKASTALVLEQLGITSFFTYIGTPDLYEGKVLSKAEVLMDLTDRLNANRDTCLMVGDMFSDIEAGKKAGMDTAAYVNGYGGNDFSKNHGANYTLRDYTQL